MAAVAPKSMPIPHDGLAHDDLPRRDLTPGAGILPFHLWKPRGIHVVRSKSRSPSRTVRGFDGFRKPLVSTDGLDDGDPSAENGSDNSHSVEAQRQARAQRLANSPLAARVEAVDAWRLGEGGSDWVEPPGTSRSDFDPATPPFARVLQAKLDFLNSRGEELLVKKRMKRLFDTMTYSLELRNDAIGPHWRGSGPDGQVYKAPSVIRKTERYVRREYDEVDLLTGNEVHPPAEVASSSRESCAFLRKPEQCIRGVLALARKEVEAGWNIEPAEKFTKIVAAFVTFLVHYAVLSESHFQEPMQRALAVARQAHAALLFAYDFENVLCDPIRFNYLCWSAWTGEYGEEGRGGPSPAREAESPASSAIDDGGWSVDDCTSVKPLSSNNALEILQSMYLETLPSEVRILSYIPFARRGIKRIIAQGEHGNSAPLPHLQDYVQIVTVPAPWTPAERWRTRVPASFEHDDGSADLGRDSDVGPLEKEMATVGDVNEITLWCPASAFASTNGRHELAIGMGLRGRWAEIGDDKTSWWVFWAKDFVLPCFWQSSSTG